MATAAKTFDEEHSDEENVEMWQKPTFSEIIESGKVERTSASLY